MMDLILWRHAEAVDMGEQRDDFERPLTSKGERQAARMATWLNRQLPSSTRVLVSPARRALQTVAPLERKFKTVPALGAEHTVEDLLHTVRWPDAREPVLVVGHRPTLNLVAAYLLAGQPQEWVMRRGGVWWLRGRQRDGVLQVLLHAVLPAELA